MPDYQPIDYRLRCHTKRTDLPADVLRDIGEAYAEIKRLRDERDEARREICKRVSVTRWEPQFPLMSETQYAEERGWDCWKENTNG